MSRRTLAERAAEAGYEGRVKHHGTTGGVWPHYRPQRIYRAVCSCGYVGSNEQKRGAAVSLNDHFRDVLAAPLTGGSER